MIRLRVLSGPNEGATLDVDDDEAVIGQDARRCAVLLHDPDVLPVHLTLSRTGDGVFGIELASGASARVDGTPVGAGRHPIGRVSLIGIGRAELLVHWLDKRSPDRDATTALPASGDTATEDSANDDTEPAADVSRADARAPRARVPVVVAAAGAISGCLLLGWLFTLIVVDSATADSGSAAQSKARVAWKATRTVSDAAVSYDPGLTQRPATATHRGGGSVLFETTPTAPTPVPAAGPAEVRRLRRFVDDANVLSIETTGGDRFELGTAAGDGYSMRWIGNEAIELSRGPERIRIEVD